MALEGTLKDLSLPDIIQFLSLSRKTGALEITGTHGFGSGTLYFHQGKVVSARLEDMPPLEAAYSFFTFPDGTFYFVESDEVDVPSQPFTSSNEFLIIEGIRRADEWERLRDRVPSLDLVLGLVADPVAGNRDINLKPDEWRVLTMINGRDTIHQISQRTGFGDFKTARIVYHLLSAGLIEPLGRAAAPPEPGRRIAPPPIRSQAPVASPPATIPNGRAGGPAPAETRPLGPAPPETEAALLDTAPLVEPAVLRRSPASPAALPPTSPIPGPPPAPRASGGPSAGVQSTGPRLVSGSALYSRFEAIAVGGLGNSGRLLLSTAYQRMRLQPSADITLEAALRFCEQFERDASMLAGSSRARQLSEKLRQAVNDSFRG